MSTNKYNTHMTGGTLFHAISFGKHTEEPKEPDTETAPKKKQITAPILSVLTAYQQHVVSDNKYTPIHVDEIASKIARLYELIRKVVDWKEDNLLRRSATERILKRLLITKIAGITQVAPTDPDTVAGTVTLELIRGGHLPNDEVPQESIALVSAAIKKYLYMLEHTPDTTPDPLLVKRKINFSTFLIELAACEIEEILARPVKETGLIEAMTAIMCERIQVKPNGIMSENEKKIHVFIAVARTLYDLDDAYITSRLVVRWYPRWHESTDDVIRDISANFMSILKEINAYLQHPWSKKFYARCERTDTAFTLLGDVMDEYKDHADTLISDLESEEVLREKIGAHYDARYKTLKKRLMRLAIFSTLSVFLSNIVTFYIVEVPMAHLFAEGFSFLTALVDFLVPSIFMFILVAIIRPPSHENRKRAIDLTYSFMYGKGKQDLYEIDLVKKRSALAAVIFGVIYLIFGGAFFTFVAYVFYIARLPISSVVFDTVTIAMNVFAAAVIRNKAKELAVDERLSIADFFLDVWSLPVAKFGEYISNKWKEYNIVAAFFTFVIETPLVFVFDFIESWSSFIKERRAELH